MALRKIKLLADDDQYDIAYGASFMLYHISDYVQKEDRRTPVSAPDQVPVPITTPAPAPAPAPMSVKSDEKGQSVINAASPAPERHRPNTKGWLRIKVYSNETSPEEILRGDIHQLNYENLLRVAKHYTGSQIVAQVNAIHQKNVLDDQKVSRKMTAAYRYVAHVTGRTSSQVRLEVADARKANFVKRTRRKRGEKWDHAG